MLSISARSTRYGSGIAIKSHSGEAFKSKRLLTAIVAAVGPGIRSHTVLAYCHSKAFELICHLFCRYPHSAIMIASSSQSARIPFSQAKVPTARQIRKAEKLEKRASMHGSRHPGRLDGAIGRLTQVRSHTLPPFFSAHCNRLSFPFYPLPSIRFL